ncbi:MAG: GspH/FimT family pseudopilin [Pseudomonadota bacterium]
MIELLGVLATAAVLLTLALPAFTALADQHRAAAGLNRMIALVNQARATAVLRNRSVVLCASDSTLPEARCAGRDDWHLGTLLFGDRNGNGRLDRLDPIYRRDAGWHSGARVRWRAFRNRSYLRFRSNGMTDWQNGSFTWCPPSGDVRLARQVVLNAGGRARLSQDSDGDGVVEDALGRPLSC